MHKKNEILKWYVISLIIIIADQLTKYAITQSLHYGEVRPVTFFFNLVLTYNTGAAFGFLSQASGWQRIFFIVIGVGAVALITYLLFKHKREKLFCLSLSMILGGAIGNLCDRIRLGYVIDFLDFYYYQFHFWAFNVADSAITCGAVLLVWDSFNPGKNQLNRQVKVKE